MELAVYGYMHEIVDMLMFVQWCPSLLAEEMVSSYFSSLVAQTSCVFIGHPLLDGYDYST